MQACSMHCRPWMNASLIYAALNITGSVLYRIEDSHCLVCSQEHVDVAHSIAMQDKKQDWDKKESYSYDKKNDYSDDKKDDYSYDKKDDYSYDKKDDYSYDKKEESDKKD